MGAITVIAGATGHGKTLMLCDMAARIAEQGRRVLYLTNEQTQAAIYKRLAIRRGLSLQAAVNDDGIIVNECAQYEAGRLLAGISAGLQNANGRPHTLIIDWLNMVAADTDKAGGAEWYRLRDLMNGINAVALDTGCAIITAAQFNRQCINPCRVGLSSVADSIGIAMLCAKLVGIWNCSKQAQWGKTGAFDAKSKVGISAPGFAGGTDGGAGGVYLRVCKERHGGRLHPGTLELDAGRAMVGGDTGRALVLDDETAQAGAAAIGVGNYKKRIPARKVSRVGA